ncbi:hypothetical protein AADG42_02655 [Ammonicoccus fulvus]|uniref:Glyoxalase-like domain-containing protein n=1 Tax=Ammonicoccus fulvus TaxID=3138240 RepID=A0ABZ3FTU6_9ACTN
MAVIDPGHPIRVARPSRSLERAERFWCHGAGLEVLWRSGAEVEGDHALLMVGQPGASWRKTSTQPVAFTAISR